MAARGSYPTRARQYPHSFAESARRNPDNVAVVYDGRSLTYRELDSITDALAAELIDRFGIRRGDRVGVMIERSELMAVYPLAIMKAGAHICRLTRTSRRNDLNLWWRMPVLT